MSARCGRSQRNVRLYAQSGNEASWTFTCLYARQYFSRAIATFIDTYPEIQLDLDLSSRRVDLVGERYDLVIRMGDLSDDMTVVARRIDEVHFALYASPIYLALHPAPTHPDELIQHTAVRLLSAKGNAQPWELHTGKQ